MSQKGSPVKALEKNLIKARKKRVDMVVLASYLLTETGLIPYIPIMSMAYALVDPATRIPDKGIPGRSEGTFQYGLKPSNNRGTSMFAVEA